MFTEIVLSFMACFEVGALVHLAIIKSRGY